MDDVKRKYAIGQKVICRATEACNMASIEIASETHPEYEFTIVGINSGDDKAYDYMLIMFDDAPKGIGWVFHEAQFDPDDHDECMLDYNISRDVLGKRGVGCYERNILRLADSSSGPAICIKCSYKNEYMTSSNYVCFNCRT